MYLYKEIFINIVFLFFIFFWAYYMNIYNIKILHVAVGPLALYIH